MFILHNRSSKWETRHGLNANHWKSSLPEMCRGVWFWLNALSGRILTERLIIQSGPLCHYWTTDTACLLHTQLLVPDESSLKYCYEGSFVFKCISIKSFCWQTAERRSTAMLWGSEMRLWTELGNSGFFIVLLLRHCVVIEKWIIEFVRKGDTMDIYYLHDLRLSIYGNKVQVECFLHY